MLRCPLDSNCKPFKNAIGFDFFKKNRKPGKYEVKFTKLSRPKCTSFKKTEINGGKQSEILIY